MDPAEEINKHASYCFLPKLSKNIEEIDNHPEYYDYKNNLAKHVPPLIDILTKGDLRRHPEFTKSILPRLTILYIERSCISPWNNAKCIEHARNINRAFQSVYRLSLDSVLLCSDFCNIQEVFDNMLDYFNKKAASNDFKKYPGLLKVYCLMLKNLKCFKVTLNPMTVFPLGLLLTEDYINANKIRGLKCCFAIIQCMNEKHFQGGNYYEVIYSTFKKIIVEKKLEVTKLLHECILEFLKIVPSNVKESRTDEIFGIMLDQIHFESNLHRKTVCFGFVRNILMIHKVNCINKRLLKVVLLENIHVCCNDAVADILLVDVLQTLQVWLTHCWCVWRLSSDHNLLSALIKLLYVSRKEKIASEIQYLIVSLILLCSQDERNVIYKNLQQSEITSPEFQEKLEEIKRDISE